MRPSVHPFDIVSEVLPVIMAAVGLWAYFRERVSTLRRAAFWVVLASVLLCVGSIFLDPSNLVMIGTSDFFSVQVIRFLLHCVNSSRR
jgi:hypothetical protein